MLRLYTQPDVVTKLLSVVIPFLNESTHLQKTLHNLRATAGEKVKIIVVNDNSDDFYDYEALARSYQCTYVKNENRKGVARSRDIGVAVADTEFVLLLDAHMKFFVNGWPELFERYLRLDGFAIYCTKSVVMDENWDVKEHSSIGCGVKFKSEQQDLTNFLSTEWLFQGQQIEQSPGLSEIPCIMGAAYAFSKDFYTKLGGLQGLHTWGFDEQLLSIKAQMAGGRCYLINELSTGHVYRTQFPYHLPTYSTPYNKMVIAFITDAFSVADLMNFANQQPHTQESAVLFEANLPGLTKLKKQLYETVFVKRIWDILPAPSVKTLEGNNFEQELTPRVLFRKQNPEICHYANVLTKSECVELVEMARLRMSASTIASSENGSSVLHPARTSSTAYFRRRENELIALIEQRICNLTGITEEQGEPLQIQFYDPGAEYKPHFDFFDPKYSGYDQILMIGGQRFATLIIYLNDVEEGGETIFPKLDLSIVPRLGNAVYFSYCDEQGELDQRSLHGGAPVAKGHKWVITKWFRQNAFEPANS